MFEESPEFVEFLKSIYGDSAQDFMLSFEQDREKETRIEMGAEGPDEMLKRFTKAIDALRKFSKIYHQKNPGRRLIVWPVSHFDVISPYVKDKVLKIDSKKEYLPVDYGSGISLMIDKAGKVASRFQGQEFNIN